jgi:protein SCO1/2
MLVFVGGYGAWKWYQVEQFRRGGGGVVVVEHREPLEEFELTERSGQPFRSREMHGKVWVVTFFFSTCPGSCPRLNGSLQYLNTLEEISDVVWVSITVDPDVDTLPVLREYADRYGADPQRWLFCRGDLGYINRIGKDFLQVDDVSWRGHRDYATVIDREGKIRGVFDATSRSQSQRMVELLKECLAEPAPPAERRPEASPAEGASSSPEVESTAVPEAA